MPRLRAHSTGRAPRRAAWWALLGPVVMTMIFLVLTADILEQGMSRRHPDYEEYVSNTPKFVPRLPGGSHGSVVAPPRNGWIAVYDDVCDRDPDMLRRLARELSDRMGSVVLLLGVEEEQLLRLILFDRGRIMDEYLSVPEYHGPLPPGDVVGFAANPTVIHRLTGADVEAVRRIARTAPVPADLPPAREMLRELAAALKVEGAEHGWSDAPDLPGCVRIERS